MSGSSPGTILMKNIMLTPEDISRIKQLAHQRNDPKEANGVHSNKFYEGRSEWQTHFDGIRAEYALAKHFGVQLPDHFSWTGDDGYDLVLPGQGTVNCRYRGASWHEFALNGSCLSEFRCDIGILVVPGRNDGVNIKGWMSYEDFVNHHRTANFGYGPRLVYPNNKLRDIAELDCLAKGSD